MAITEKELHTLFHHFLEDEVLIVITNFKDISVDQVIKCSLPFRCCLRGLLKVVNFLLTYISVQNFLVDSSTETGRNTTFSVLDKERLVILV